MTLIKPAEEFELKENSFYLGEIRGINYYYWRFEGAANVPLELALQLEEETPQRFQITDRAFLIELKSHITKIIEKDGGADLPINYAEIDQLKGVGPQQIKEIKALFSLARSNMLVIQTLINGGNTPLATNVDKILSAYLKKKFPVM